MLVQVITAIETPLLLPAWTDTLVIVLLFVGFSVALVLSWAYFFALLRPILRRFVANRYTIVIKILPDGTFEECI